MPRGARTAVLGDPGGCARVHVGAWGRGLLLAADGPTLGAAATYARHGTHGEEGAREVPVLAGLRLLRSAASADPAPLETAPPPPPARGLQQLRRRVTDAPPHAGHSGHVAASAARLLGPRSERKARPRGRRGPGSRCGRTAEESDAIRCSRGTSVWGAAS